MKVGTNWRPHQGLLDAMRDPERPSPYDRDCSGMLVVLADDGKRPVEFECGECGEHLTVPQAVFAS